VKEIYILRNGHIPFFLRAMIDPTIDNLLQIAESIASATSRIDFHLAKVESRTRGCRKAGLPSRMLIDAGYKEALSPRACGVAAGESGPPVK